MTEFKVTIKKKREYVGNVYTAFVTVFENGRRLWSKSTGIRRVMRKDAIDDANKLAAELAQ